VYVCFSVVCCCRTKFSVSHLVVYEVQDLQTITVKVKIVHIYSEEDLISSQTISYAWNQLK